MLSRAFMQYYVCRRNLPLIMDLSLYKPHYWTKVCGSRAKENENPEKIHQISDFCEMAYSYFWMHFTYSMHKKYPNT